jgi:hypothetical protein
VSGISVHQPIHGMAMTNATTSDPYMIARGRASWLSMSSSRSR